MFNQQALVLCLIVLICLYLAVKIYSWWHKDNEKIGREGLMIQLEEVRKQRDEIASQLMIFRLQAQKTDSNKPEPKGYKEFNDFLRKENEEIKDRFIEWNIAYMESQRKLNEFENVSIRFMRDFESLLEEGKGVTEIVTAHCESLKTLLK